jgi:hypothetical protein
MTVKPRPVSMSGTKTGTTKPGGIRGGQEMVITYGEPKFGQEMVVKPGEIIEMIGEPKFGQEMIVKVVSPTAIIKPTP